MITTLITTSALALFTAGIAMPATRKIMLGDIKQDWLAGELELDRIEGDIVYLKSGKMFKVVRVTGTPYETKPEQQQVSLRDNRSDWLHQLGQFPVAIKLFGVKCHRSISFESEWPSSTLAEIGEQEKHLFENSYEVRWYVILESNNLRNLTEATKKTEALLSSYGAKTLALDVEQCELTSFLHTSSLESLHPIYLQYQAIYRHAYPKLILLLIRKALSPPIHQTRITRR